MIEVKFNCGCNLVFGEDEDGILKPVFSISHTCSTYHTYLHFELFPKAFYISPSIKDFKVGESVEEYRKFISEEIRRMTNENNIGSLEDFAVTVVVKFETEEFEKKQSIYDISRQPYIGIHFIPFRNRFSYWKGIAKEYIPELSTLLTSLYLLLPSNISNKTLDTTDLIVKTSLKFYNTEVEAVLNMIQKREKETKRIEA